VRVLVTGANGHLGCNVIRELLHQNHQIVPFVRAGADIRGIAGLGLSLKYGDILDHESVADAAVGCDAILHLAAPYRTRSNHPDDIVRPALLGTRNVLHAAARHRIARVVATSSVTAIGYVCTSEFTVSDQQPPPRCEDDWNPSPRLPYFRAKLAAEREAWRLADELGVPQVVLCPGAMLGRYDYRTTPTTSYVQHLAAGTGFSAPGGLNLVDARDVAWAHVAALTRGQPGSRYAIGGDNLSYRAIAALCAAQTGIAVKHIPLPRAVLLPFLRMHEIVDRARGRESWETYLEAYETLGRYAFIDSARATRELGYRPRPAGEAVADALCWLAFLGNLPPLTAVRVLATLPPEHEWTRAAA
jgi:dihydroflavonol-4-reductase